MAGDGDIPSGLMFFVVLDDFLDDEGQEFLGEFGVEIGLLRKIGEPGDLRFLADRVGGGQVVLGLEPAHGLVCLNRSPSV